MNKVLNENFMGALIAGALNHLYKHFGYCGMVTCDKYDDIISVLYPYDGVTKQARFKFYVNDMGTSFSILEKVSGRRIETYYLDSVISMPMPECIHQVSQLLINYIEMSTDLEEYSKFPALVEDLASSVYDRLSTLNELGLSKVDSTRCWTRKYETLFHVEFEEKNLMFSLELERTPTQTVDVRMECISSPLSYSSAVYESITMEELLSDLPSAVDNLTEAVMGCVGREITLCRYLGKDYYGR